MKLFYKKYENQNTEEYIVILHGLFGMLDNWHNMARRFSENYNVITVDQRNHGKSPHSMEMSFELMANDLAELMNCLNIEKANILGHSMGGKTAMVFADLHPDKVQSLIIVDIAPKKYKPGHTAYFNAFNTIDFTQSKSRKDADNQLSKIESNFAIRQFLLKNLEKGTAGYRLKLNLQSIERFYPVMIDAINFQWVIQVKTLFILGENSNYVTENDHVIIEETFTNAQFATIPNAGHWVHAEQPNAFYDQVLEFLH